MQNPTVINDFVQCIAVIEGALNGGRRCCCYI